MTEISLRAYIEYIEDRLGRDAYTEVIAQCRHILSTYPKHVGAYKLLARALAAQENYQDALDLFQRVLSADPNDFIAHIGMSDCYRVSGTLEQATWHLERAFEQVPSNTDLQGEIRRLYTQRGVQAPRKIQLTGGALARLYAKGKLYSQAIAELRKAIAADPERLDLQTLLAEVLWDAHQNVPAARVAAQVLKRLPYSIQANRVLCQLWMQAGKPKEARPFLERVKELDPYLGYELEHDGRAASKDAFRLVMMEFRPEEHAAALGAADWVSQIGAIEKQEGVTGPLKPSGAITDIFLEGEGAKQPAAARPPGPAGPAPDWLSEAFESAQAQSAWEEDTPDWLQEALQEAPPVAASGVPPAPAPPGEIGEPTPPVTPAVDDAPDWLQEVLAEAPSDQAARPAREPVEPPPAPAPAEGTPDWLQDILSETPTPAPSFPSEKPSAEEPPQEGEGPEWLQDVLAGTPASAPQQPAPAPVGREAPEWLAEILAGSPPEGKAPPTEAEEPAGPAMVSTDWLDGVITSSAPGVTPPPGEGAMPDWLAEPEASVTPSAPEPESPTDLRVSGQLDTWDAPLPSVEADDELPPPPDDWLTQETGLEGPGETESIEAEEELPDWLKADVSPAPVEQEPVDEQGEQEPLPDWLEAGAVQIEGDRDVAQVESEEEALPDWLAEAPASTESAAPVLQEDSQVTPPKDEPTGDETSQDDIPDWLAEGDLDSDDALAWLEEIAAKYDPDFKATEEAETTEPVAEAEAPAQPAAEAEPARAEVAEDLEWLREPTEKPVAQAEEEEELPDWLRVEEEAEPVEAEAALPLPDDTLAWLDQKVAEQGVSPEKVVSQELIPDQPPVVAPPPPDLDAKAEPAAADELPDWLRETEAQEQIAKAIESPVPDAEMAEFADLEVEEEELAWLDDALKAEEAVASAEPEGLLEAEEEEGLPDWLKEPEVAPTPTPVAEAEPVEAVVEEEELPDWLKEPEAAPTPPPVAEAEPVEAVAEEEELPDWLREPEAAPPAPAEVPTPPEPEPEPEPEPIEAEALPSWLEAPAEAPADAGLEDFLEAAAPARPSAERPEPVAAAPPPPAPTPAPPPPAPAVSAPEAAQQLAQAREQVSAGKIKDAVALYEALLKGNQSLDEVSADLVNLIQTKSVDPVVYRLAGDALMAQGRTQEALEMFRKALDQF